MIDIIGFIKVDESKPERVNYLLCCIRSYQFLAKYKSPTGVDSTITIALESPSIGLLNAVANELIILGFKYFNVVVAKENSDLSYGKQYHDLIEIYSKNEFIINFMEDQFMVADDASKIQDLLSEMREEHAQVCRSSFFFIERKCLLHACPNGNKSNMNTEIFHAVFQEPYVRRFWVGVNFITTTVFAKAFWGRDCGSKPHNYEMSHYDERFLHEVIVPDFEIQCPIDDDHDAEGTSLLKRDNAKFCRIYTEIKKLKKQSGININFNVR